MSSPQTWPPYTAGQDCSLGFCSGYCPQWCFVYFPPPPPPSPRNFALSPLFIAIIIVITSAFFIVTSYLIALKYRNNRRSPTSLTSIIPSTWLPPSSSGLDSSLINKLAIFRYQRGDCPIVDGESDCSVCLGEFREGDSLRLLPKCGHSFHASCIDTWLRSHSNCPLCRAGVMGPSEEEEDEVVISEDLEEERGDGEGDGDVVIEIREEGYEVMMAGESSDGMALVSIKPSVSPAPGNGELDSL